MRAVRLGAGGHAAPILILLLALLAAACTAVGGQRSIPPSGAGGVSIPTDDMSAADQCMLESGFRIVAVHQSSGKKTWYSWEYAGVQSDGPIKMQACQKLAAKPAAKTDAELHEIYTLWVEERECLVDLGYSPAKPPSFEKFAADWRSTGPWMPMDGLDYSSWTSEQYREAKERCTLEMYDR